MTTDPAQAADKFRNARGDAPAWPAWGPTRAYYLAWVDNNGRLDSMLFVDPAAQDQVNALRAALLDVIEAQGTHVERADGPDVDETMPMTLLYAIVETDGRVNGPGYGNSAQGLFDAGRSENWSTGRWATCPLRACPNSTTGGSQRTVRERRLHDTSRADAAIGCLLPRA